MASAVPDEQKNDENYWKISCYRSRNCRYIANQLNTSVSETIDNNDAWSELQKEAFKKRFAEVRKFCSLPVRK
jgi:hypothetical protein